MPVIADTQDIRPAKPAAPGPPRRCGFQLAATADEAAVLRYLLVKPFEKFWEKADSLSILVSRYINLRNTGSALNEKLRFSTFNCMRPRGAGPWAGGGVGSYYHGHPLCGPGRWLLRDVRKGEN